MRTTMPSWYYIFYEQVKALCDLPCGGVPATYLNSQQTKTEVTAVFNELRTKLPSIKLLYITPEQFVKSGRLQDVLQSLNQQGLLARIVIDEVS